MQLVLSIVVSLILVERYTYEKKQLLGKDNKLAMKNALRNSAPTILSACIGTIVGLMSLAFMSFGIGQEMGFVFAKGIFFVLVSLYLVLPSLLLWSDKLIEKCDKGRLIGKIKVRRAKKQQQVNSQEVEHEKI